MGLRSSFNQVEKYMGMYRHLTPDEIQIARKIYQDNLDYSQVKIYSRRIWPAFAQSGNRAVAFRNNTSFPGPTYSLDFSKSHKPEKRGVFIHEIGHPWQHQNKIFNHVNAYLALQFSLKNAFQYQRGYFYKLDAEKTLLDYGFEQQAAILQDYYMLKHEGVVESFKNRRLNEEQDPETLLALYETVLDDFFKKPTQQYVEEFVKEKKIKPFARPPEESSPVLSLS